MEENCFKALVQQEDVLAQKQNNQTTVEGSKRKPKKIWDVPSYDPLSSTRSAEKYLYVSFYNKKRENLVPAPQDYDIKLKRL